MAALPKKASEVAPKAFASGVGSGGEDRPDDLIYDLHHMAAFDNHPVDLEQFKSDAEACLKEMSTFSIQGLVKRLFELPSESTDVGPVVELPPAITGLPRSKPIPPPKEETKWEKYAKEKGITKKKRSRMLWDEEHQEWRPRWGYKRANAGVLDQPVVEVKQGQDPFVDPWTEAKKAKQQRVEKNLKQHKKNLQRAGKGPATFGLPLDLAPSKKDAAAAAGPQQQRKKGKADGLKALEVAQTSTASLGKFDRKLEGELEKKKGPKIKKVGSAVDPKALKSEASRMGEILASVIRPKGATERPRHVNIDALEKPAGFKRKKGRGHEGGAGSAKKKRKA